MANQHRYVFKKYMCHSASVSLYVPDGASLALRTAISESDVRIHEATLLCARLVVNETGRLCRELVMVICRENIVQF